MPTKPCKQIYRLRNGNIISYHGHIKSGMQLLGADNLLFVCLSFK